MRLRGRSWGCERLLDQHEADYGSDLHYDNDEQLGRKWLFARLVTEQATSQQSTWRTADQRKAEEVAFRYAAFAAHRALFVLPETKDRPQVDQCQKWQCNG